MDKGTDVIYKYVYIYMCVCVCTCTCVSFNLVSSYDVEYLVGIIHFPVCIIIRSLTFTLIIQSILSSILTSNFIFIHDVS